MSKNCWIIFFILSIYSQGFSQTADTAMLRQLYLKAREGAKYQSDSSIKQYERIIELTKKQPDFSIVAYTYSSYSELLFARDNDLAKRLKLRLKSATIFRAIGDSLNYYYQYQAVSIILANLGRTKDALNYSREAFVYAQNKKVWRMLVSSAVSISDYYCMSQKADSAIYILEYAKKNLPNSISPNDLGTLYQNLGNAYFNLGDETTKPEYYIKSIENSKKAIEIYIHLEHEEDSKAYLYGLIGASNMKLGDYKAAEKNYIDAISYFELNKALVDLEPIYFELVQLYIKTGDKYNATTYLKKHDSISKVIFNNNNIESVSEMETKYQTEKKETENKLLQAQNDLSGKAIKQQKLISYFIISGLLIVSCLAFFIFRGLKKQRHANHIISEQKLIVEHQKELVEEKHKEITDSINYAERIQRSFLASKELLQENLKDYFVFFQPKDVVSGDFYWASSASATNGNKDLFYLTTADSTGHGVPGAIMSLLNITSLESAINDGHIAPADILNSTRKTIIERLKKDGSAEGGKDGMDCSLICFDFANNVFTYSAANNPVWVVRQNQLIELAPDKMPVGKHDKDQLSFTQHEFQLQKGDTVYALTDGLADQFGGPNGKKYKYKQLKELLTSIAILPTEIQKEKLKESFVNWKGNLEQVDDILIIGIKLPQC